MKNNFCFLVIIALIVVKSCESIEVIFRHHVYENDLKKTLFNCTIRWKEDREVLTRLTISKDTQHFYTLAANDPNCMYNIHLCLVYYHYFVPDMFKSKY